MAGYTYTEGMSRARKRTVIVTWQGAKDGDYGIADDDDGIEDYYDDDDDFE